jgi:hypothetical protein
MRRLIILSLVIGLTASPVSATIPVDPYAGADQVAFSIWLLEEGSRLTLYLAQGGRHLDNETPPNIVGLPAYGVVARGRCKLTKKGGVCLARGKVHTLISEFEMDPSMASAHMTLEAGRFTHVVDWTGEETVAQDSDMDGTNAYFSMYRPASVTATLYNREFTGGDLWSLMQNGAYAGEGERIVTFHPDGTFSARVALDADGDLVAP